MKRTIRKSVGIIGLGIIGRRIADHLRHQGLSVFVWNRTPKPVPNFVGSPSELAQTCNYLQVFVSDDDALMRMIQTISMALTPRHIVIAHPTVSPETMREAAGLVERRGARLVEAPFTGSKLGAEKGQLVYYVSGDEAAIEEVRPLLQASSKAIVNIGAIGEASIIKIATNMVTAASVQGNRSSLGHSAGKIFGCAQAKRQQFRHARPEGAANHCCRLQAAFFGQAHAQRYADRESDGPTL
jgi:3-hydroxyisobutyrate dehydrogenase-like beta-hydroxyacid dehydrogenase